MKGSNNYIINSRLEKFLDFLVVAFLLTDVYIIVFSNLLLLLNFLYPVSAKVKFYRPAVAFPERFEMLLYLILSFLSVMIVWILHKLINVIPNSFRDLLRHSREGGNLLKFTGLIFLLSVFISKLGVYPLLNEIYPYSLRSSKTIYNLILFIYLSSIAIIITEFYILSRLRKRSNLLTYVIYLFVALIIAAFIFEPRFPLSPLEYAFFFGPIWDVAQGKTIFTDISSQYGFLSIFFFSLLLKLKLFSFSHLAVYNFIMHIIQYFICFYLIYKISRSLALSLLGLFSIMTVNYFSFYVPVLTIAQYGALRRLPFFLALFLFYKLKRIDSPLFIFLYALLSFWIVDSGMQMSLALGLTLFLLFLTKSISLKQMLKSCFIFILSSAGIFSAINLLHILFGLKAINPFEIVTTLRQYALSGVGMLPMEAKTYFWLVILIYFASIIYSFKTTNEPDQRTVHGPIPNGSSGIRVSNPLSTIILFSANLMLFASVYYVGRSMPHELITVSVFAILSFFLLVGSIYQNLSSMKIRLFLLLIVFSFLMVFPAYQRKEFIAEKIIDKYQKLLQGNILASGIDEELQKKYKREAELVNDNIKTRQLLIISPDDTYLFYLTKKQNLIDINPLWGTVDRQSAMDSLLGKIDLCPEELVVDCSLVNRCQPYKTFVSQTANIAFPQLLKGLEKKCKMFYQPSKCTNQLCIAHATNLK